jgi:phage-related protein
MLQTFNPPVPPSPGTKAKPEIKLLKADFGDGYTQSGPEGLNHIRRTLALQWDVLLPEQCADIIAFFEARGGFEPFWYTPSDETTPDRWTCEEWDDVRGTGGLRSATATLKESFALG